MLTNRRSRLLECRLCRSSQFPIKQGTTQQHTEIASEKLEKPKTPFQFQLDFQSGPQLIPTPKNIPKDIDINIINTKGFIHPQIMAALAVKQYENKIKAEKYADEYFKAWDKKVLYVAAAITFFFFMLQMNNRNFVHFENLIFEMENGEQDVAAITQRQYSDYIELKTMKQYYDISEYDSNSPHRAKELNVTRNMLPCSYDRKKRKKLHVQPSGYGWIADCKTKAFPVPDVETPEMKEFCDHYMKTRFWSKERQNCPHNRKHARRYYLLVEQNKRLVATAKRISKKIDRAKRKRSKKEKKVQKDEYSQI